MNKPADIHAVLKNLRERAASDEVLTKALEQLEGLLDDVEPNESDSSHTGRTGLPYSSDPVPVDEIWN